MASQACSTNIVRLPTAAPRKVQQRYNQHLRNYRAENPWPGKDWRKDWTAPPSDDRPALQRSPELLILMAVLRALPEDQRAVVHGMVMDVHLAVPCEESREALKIVGRLK